MSLNATTAASVMIAIEPWRADLYHDLSGRSSLAAHVRSVALFDGHRAALKQTGDAAAVAGTAVPIRIALLKLAGADAATRRALECKIAILVEHRWAWSDYPMSVVMIEAAIVADAYALKLDRDEEQQLLQRLRGAA